MPTRKDANWPRRRGAHQGVLLDPAQQPPVLSTTTATSALLQTTSARTLTPQPRRCSASAAQMVQEVKPLAHRDHHIGSFGRLYRRYCCLEAGYASGTRLVGHEDLRLLHLYFEEQACAAAHMLLLPSPERTLATCCLSLGVLKCHDRWHRHQEQDHG